MQFHPLPALGRQQQGPGLFLLILGDDGVQGPGDILDGVLFVGAVTLLPGVDFVGRHPEKVADVDHRDVVVLYKLGIRHGGGQGRVGQPVVQNGHLIGVVRPAVDPVPLFPQGVLPGHVGVFP